MKNKNYAHLPKFYGKKVREMRKLRGISQEELSKKSGLHWTYISSVERGERNISLINICKIAAALEVSGKDFIPDI